MQSRNADVASILAPPSRGSAALLRRVLPTWHSGAAENCYARLINWGATMKKFALGILIALTGATCATAADLYVKAPVVAPVYNWTGFYIGGNVGGAWGNFDPTTSTVFSPVGYFAASSVPAINGVGLQSGKPSGVTGGFEAGYNWQIRNVVVGVEGDIEALSLSSSATGGAVYPCCAPTAFTVTSNVSTTWLATVRGRLGYAVNNWLFFVTGGAAFTDLRGNFAFSDTFANAAESASFSDTKTGYTMAAASRLACGATGASRANISTLISAPFRRAAPI
jgi:outer membrane immunogenic protein